MAGRIVLTVWQIILTPFLDPSTEAATLAPSPLRHPAIVQQAPNGIVRVKMAIAGAGICIMSTVVTMDAVVEICVAEIRIGTGVAWLG